MTTKQQIIDLITRLPEEISINQAIEELYLLHKIQKGLEQVETGQVVPHEEVKRRYLSETAASE